MFLGRLSLRDHHRRCVGEVGIVTAELHATQQRKSDTSGNWILGLISVLALGGLVLGISTEITWIVLLSVLAGGFVVFVLFMADTTSTTTLHIIGEGEVYEGETYVDEQVSERERETQLSSEITIKITAPDTDSRRLEGALASDIQSVRSVIEQAEQT